MTIAQFDITPHPRILSILGEIEFKPWQCIAELLDNSIDGFLDMQRAGTPIIDPTAAVAFGRDTVVVKDNGPGMTINALESAVKAGWSSREKFGSLGLYGVGFNIATARLGAKTQILTSVKGAREWYGLTIDLPQMTQGSTYKLDVITQAKSDPDDSGTRVEVSNIKSDWRNLLSNTNWLRSNVTNKLGRVYGAMLRDDNPQPIKFRLLVNNKKVQAWEHCIWPADFTVFRQKEGDVSPIQEFDRYFATKYLSRSTGEMHETPDELEPDDVIEIQERVYGWLGIQRYADESDYGIDILRNGRKIEIECKDLFQWENSEGRQTPEYPIDDPRYRGRIVGEVHLDHGYVHYTKNKFEREHYSWKQLLQAVRNNEPLTNRAKFAYTDVNTSPLGLLFRVFRRNSPMKGQTHREYLLFRENNVAKQWVAEWRKGNAEYRSEKKWREELDRPDVEPQPANPADEDDFVHGGFGDASSSSDTNGGSSQGTGNDGGEQPEKNSVGDGHGAPFNTASQNDARDIPPEPRRELLPEFSLHITGVGSAGKSYNVEAYSTEFASDGAGHSAWSGRLTERNVYEIDVNLQHPAFNSSSLQVRDAILADVSFLITSEEQATLGRQQTVNYGDILVALRSRFAVMDSLDVNQLRLEIDQLRSRFTARLSMKLSDDQQRKLLENLPPDDLQRIELADARSSTSQPIINFLQMSDLALLFSMQPSLFFDLGCFTRSWTPSRLAQNSALLEEHQRKLAQEIWILLASMGDLDTLSAPAKANSRSALAYVRACINRIHDFVEP